MRRPCLCSATPYLLPNAVRLQHVNYGQTDSIKVCLPRSGFVQQVRYNTMDIWTDEIGGYDSDVYEYEVGKNHRPKRM